MGIKVARSNKGIIISQIKYVLDLLTETCMLGCKLANSPIEINYKLRVDEGEKANKGKYHGS